MEGMNWIRAEQAVRDHHSDVFCRPELDGIQKENRQQSILDREASISGYKKMLATFIKEVIA